jgi:hypothetical protein
MPELIEDIITDTERKVLLEYLSTDDDRADIRPDVSSKHPRWDIDVWPQHIIEKALYKIFPEGFKVTEVTLQDTHIGLKPHTDNGSVDGKIGKTAMFLLDADPVAHTVFFDNYWTGWRHTGAFFTKQEWSPFQYKLPGKDGNMVYINDIRDLLEQCKTSPLSVTEFDVTEDFVNLVEHTVKKRSLPRDEHLIVNKETGYIQAGPRINDYTTLTNYEPNLKFDQEIHNQYLFDVPFEDLHGLTLNSIIEWKLNGVVLFDREMLHASSSCHTRKKFVTIFCHAL